MPSSLKSLRCEINSALIGIIWRQYIYEYSGVCRVIYVTLFSQALLDNNIERTEISTRLFASTLSLCTNVPFLVTITYTKTLEGHLKSWILRNFDDFLSQCLKL
jgi:hypothetical protein